MTTQQIHDRLAKMQAQRRNRARLLISCPDRPGIIASVSQFLFERGANILQSDQHSTDPSSGLFFMRIEFELAGIEESANQFEAEFAQIASKLSMSWRLEHASVPKRIAIFVSREDHCLLELLWQWQSGDLFGDIVMVISNHDDARAVVEPYGIPYYHIPVQPDNKREAERAQLELLEGSVDLVVLARYMQILSPAFVERHRNRIINIHHSFLPAFIGKNPYGRAYDRGVKLIGATAHYVTEDLDEGPIIEQDVHRVNHRDSVNDLKRIGRHVERVVLARAVKWHLEDRILIHQNKTVVFA